MIAPRSLSLVSTSFSSFRPTDLKDRSAEAEHGSGSGIGAPSPTRPTLERTGEPVKLVVRFSTCRELAALPVPAGEFSEELERGGPAARGGEEALGGGGGPKADGKNS